MARKQAAPLEASAGTDGGGEGMPEPGVLITFRPEAAKEALSFLSASTGKKNVAFAAEFASGAVDPAQVRDADLLVMSSLGIAVADLDPDQKVRLSTAGGGEGAIIAVEPEPIFFAFADGLPADLHASSGAIGTR